MSNIPISVLVTATVSEHTREGAAAAGCSYELIAVDGFQIERNAALEAAKTLSLQWGTYVGDARALTADDKLLCAKPAAELEPPEVYLRNCALDLCMKLCGEIGPALQ
jgi:hypothetical protein